MNISAQPFATKTRTWLFIAGLTALLIGIGALIGGMFLYAFVALAVVMSVFDYRFSDRGLRFRRAGRSRSSPGRTPQDAKVPGGADRVVQQRPLCPLPGDRGARGPGSHPCAPWALDSGIHDWPNCYDRRFHAG
jgi:hypothetical protein